MHPPSRAQKSQRSKFLELPRNVAWWRPIVMVPLHQGFSLVEVTGAKSLATLKVQIHETLNLINLFCFAIWTCDLVPLACFFFSHSWVANTQLDFNTGLSRLRAHNLHCPSPLLTCLKLKVDGWWKSTKNPTRMRKKRVTFFKPNMSV